MVSFALDDAATAQVISTLKDRLQALNPEARKSLNAPLTYLLDELICNIQQHAQTDKGYVYLSYNADTDFIEIVIADCGITIYGSYVAAQKHLDKLGDSDAEALNLAQNGYSVKNLPETENRGYGISSNIKMVVDGLHGEFATLSGNALLLQMASNRKILSLPPEIDFKGTMIMARIPAQVPDKFNMYDYMS
jgi:anti-sigma regulatory factor (Ser/Thr protein kinase)